jgi:uncharacterized protein YbjT (DUF2867 family)
MTSSSAVDSFVVVPGGTGNVGEGIVRAFLEAGATDSLTTCRAAGTSMT